MLKIIFFKIKTSQRINNGSVTNHNKLLVSESCLKGDRSLTLKRGEGGGGVTCLLTIIYTKQIPKSRVFSIIASIHSEHFIKISQGGSRIPHRTSAAMNETIDERPYEKLRLYIPILSYGISLQKENGASVSYGSSNVSPLLLFFFFTVERSRHSYRFLATHILYTALSSF